MNNGPYTVLRTCTRDCPNAWDCLLINNGEPERCKAYKGRKQRKPQNWYLIDFLEINN